MIRQTDADQWEEFPLWVSNLNNERLKYKQASELWVSEPLFRGHAAASWQLQTTLERYEGASLRADEFYAAIYAAKPQIESYTKQTWDIPSPDFYNEWLEMQSALGLSSIPAYDYMVYLRHHGFPSPLLDWSASPYVAAYFAFSAAVPSSERVAIYGFIDYIGQARGGLKGEPNIHVHGPHVRTHPRHFLQQSQYTLCTQYDMGNWKYVSHENAFSAEVDDQDLIWKITLPVSERIKALRYLDTFNLNSFSLFGSDESLMETMAMRILIS